MIQLHARRICVVLLLVLLPMLSACMPHVYPRYQPISESSGLSRPVQGYQDIQIDGETYFIAYMNYYSFSFGHGLPGDPRDDKWLKGAQEYVLYRAAELAQSKGAHYFVVLYQDDWNLTRVERRYYKQGDYANWEPGAGLIVRVLQNYPSSMLSNNSRVYEVGLLLQSLTEKNSGLAEYQKKTVHDESVRTAGNGFTRWRSSVSGYDSVLVPGTRQRTFIGQEYIKFKPGSAIIPEVSPRQFEIAMWDDKLISPLQLLSECVKLVDQQKYEAFKLMNWTVKEYRNDDTHYRDGGWKVWFRTKATVVLQHQNEQESLEPVFVVDEIRPNVMSNK